MRVCRVMMLFELLAFLPFLGGCQLPRGSDIPPEPPAAKSSWRGLLLEADSLHLGPDAGRNLWRIRGDGMLGL